MSILVSPITLLFYTFAVFGLCWGIGGSKLTLPIRVSFAAWIETEEAHGQPVRASAFLLDLIECPACLGFWFGLLFGFIDGAGYKGAISIAFYTAGVNYLLGRLTGLITEA